MKNKEFSPKEKAIYRAVIDLFREGADLNSLTVAEITGKAGIGKGTAYEYFSDKEEMIAKAVFYYTEEFCHNLYEQMKGEPTLPGKINLVLKKLEDEVVETNCIFRLIHAMVDNSVLGKRMKAIDKNEAFHSLPAEEMIARVIMDETQGAKITVEMREYLTMSFFSRLVSYGMYLQRNTDAPKEKKKMMRELVCQGICKEIAEI